jgi:DNA-binding NarL/FixJ family response regulator
LNSVKSLPESGAVKVAVASSRPAVVAAWVARLAGEPRLRVAGAPASDARSLVAALAREAPQVVLLDVAALEWVESGALRPSRAERSGPRVLLVCDSAGQQLVELVLRNRLDGYLVRDERAEACAKAILGVNRGELWLPRAGLAAALYARLNDAPQASAVDQAPKAVPRVALTERERQVADCVRNGSSNSEIARALGIKRDTVKKHLRSMFGKLGVQSRSEIAAAHALGFDVAREQPESGRRGALA